MDSQDGWRWQLRPEAQPVSYLDPLSGQWVSGSFETAVKSEQGAAVVTSPAAAASSSSAPFVAACASADRQPWRGALVTHAPRHERCLLHRRLVRRWQRRGLSRRHELTVVAAIRRRIAVLSHRCTASGVGVQQWRRRGSRHWAACCLDGPRAMGEAPRPLVRRSAGTKAPRAYHAGCCGQLLATYLLYSPAPGRR